MIKYNICFIRQGDRVLLLNRNKPSWMGAWNGVGGKLEPGETPRDSMLRELKEETGVVPERLYFKGVVTWVTDGVKTGGMYVYAAELPADAEYPAPLPTDEGILDWKELSWILHPENRGVAYNIPKSIETILFDEHCYEHICTYKNGELLKHESVRIEPDIENMTDLSCSKSGSWHTYGGENIVLPEGYTLVEKMPTLEEYIHLCTAVGWEEVMNFAAAEQSLRQSLYGVTLLHGNELAGMGRIVGDGAIYFYIQDIIVVPEHQNKGLGRAILESITGYIRGHAPDKAFVGLFASHGKEDFYRKFGFNRHEGMTGMFGVVHVGKIW
ncbi:hypothetical protein PAJ34TS1_42180 [Paenibacillus azoreducens]|uniref:8-oxo-dGTP diphosphatase n=2 Tax=Paenibacillus azoreducens TaxID=116718 RepID=A0A920CR90_9BACL|nr:hypothetical protein J34TS1_55060 [Paenibacillus azoreducens]